MITFLLKQVPEKTNKKLEELVVSTNSENYVYAKIIKFNIVW